GSQIDRNHVIAAVAHFPKEQAAEVLGISRHAHHRDAVQRKKVFDVMNCGHDVPPYGTLHYKTSMKEFSVTRVTNYGHSNNSRRLGQVHSWRSHHHPPTSDSHPKKNVSHSNRRRYSPAAISPGCNTPLTGSRYADKFEFRGRTIHAAGQHEIQRLGARNGASGEAHCGDLRRDACVRSRSRAKYGCAARVLTLYTGVRLNDSTELLVDIEEAGGAALSTGLGLAGAPNLDIVRNPLLSKAPYLARGLIHKVFALSKDKVENQRNFLSLFDEVPRRRLEIRFGKFSMADFFDQNSVGSDTHFQFANWTVDNNGAYDYAADTRGYTVGAVAEFQDRNWGFRFAEALMPKVANGIDLVWRPWQVHAENFEYELRRGFIPRKAGVLRLLAYTNYANMGIYREAIAQFEKGLVLAPDITHHPWRITRKYGFGV